MSCSPLGPQWERSQDVPGDFVTKERVRSLQQHTLTHTNEAAVKTYKIPPFLQQHTDNNKIRLSPQISKLIDLKDCLATWALGLVWPCHCWRMEWGRVWPCTPLPAGPWPTALGHHQCHRTTSSGQAGDMELWTGWTNHSPQIGDTGTPGKLSLVTSFLGLKRGNSLFFFFSCFQTNFKMVMIKQTLCTVRASHLIHSLDPNHSLK